MFWSKYRISFKVVLILLTSLSLGKMKKKVNSETNETLILEMFSFSQNSMQCA